MYLYTKYSYFIVRIFILSLALCATVFACKYTVRDIGFTDLGATTYQLYIYVDDHTPQEMIAKVERIAYAAFLNANVRMEIIHTDRQTAHPAMGNLKTQKNISIPAVILTDPNRHSLVMPFNYKQENLTESLWRLIEKVVSSPIRKQIRTLVTNSYGSVLLIEGRNKEKNVRAKKEISGALGNILQVMKLMPKPVKEPPQLIVLSGPAYSAERVLLWSLDTPVQAMEEPRLAVLYSRGRRIGPVLKGPEITKENIFSLLAIIGADCECGLDRSVMLGKMIPLRWEKEVQADLISSLGFDVENPMVKSEMRQILSISPAAKGGKNSTSPLSAYSEGLIKFNPVSSVPTVSSDPFRASASSEPVSTSDIISRRALYSAAGILTLVLIIGGFILIRARQRQN